MDIYKIYSYPKANREMKNIALLIMFLLLSINAFSQDTEDIQISYTYLYRSSMEQKYPSEKTWLLSLGMNCSSFYPQATTKMMTGEFYEDRWGMRVYKNIPSNGELIYRESILTNILYYVEKIPGFQWKSLDGDSTVCNYPCQKAVTTFRGRTWVVWYTMDLPYSDGPWKLCGLPGLILKAEDTKGDFSFTAYKITKGLGKEIKADLKNAVKVKPQDLEQDMDDYMRHPLEYMYSVNKVKADYSNAPELAPKSRIPCRMESFAKKKNKTQGK